MDQQAASPAGRYLRFGVREHAMAAIGNGLVVHGGLRAYVATFFVFTDYMRAAMRIGAIMRQPVIHILTHDSVGLGEDGPTHQPVEHLAILRATPEWLVVRPADANETVEAWRIALRRTDGPTALVLTRQALPVIDREQVRAGRRHRQRRLRAGRRRRRRHARHPAAGQRQRGAAGARRARAPRRAKACARAS